jgi:hypothetical protein
MIEYDLVQKEADPLNMNLIDRKRLTNYTADDIAGTAVFFRSAQAAGVSSAV